MGGLKEKKCFKCENILPLCDFYKHKGMSDGHLNKCKNCTKSDVRKNEEVLKKNPEWVINERKRNRDKYYKLNYRGLYKQTSNKKKETINRYNRKFPEKALARKYTEIFLTKSSNTHLHHWSYNQEHWLDVIELTIKDHYFLHRYIIYNQERMMYRGINNILLDSKEKHLEYFNECKLKYEY